MTTPILAIQNKSTVVTDTEMRAAVTAMQTQVDRDFAPIYGASAQVILAHPDQALAPGTWVVTVADTSDEAGALGYHTPGPGHTYAPNAYVFAKDDKKYGLSWTVTLSHEVLEMLADPDCVRAAQLSQTTWVAYEMCDPVEADNLGYMIGDVRVSDFVLPAWFGGGLTGPYDFTRHLTRPATLAKGGYISLWTPSRGWTQKTAEAAPGVTSRAATSQRTHQRPRVRMLEFDHELAL